MKHFETKELWFVTGSQHLYGEEVLKQVESNSVEIAAFINDQETTPVNVVFKGVLTGPAEISKRIEEANNSPACMGLLSWMHTFSPAKMWINGLKILNKPLVHLHTQFQRDIPWHKIDMDYMNLNQSAHGGREYGFILSRMRKDRKVIAGYWKDPVVLDRLNTWIRAAVAWNEWQGMRIARFGDNMREVAVTEGNKVSAELQFGFSVSGYGVGDLVKVIQEVEEGRLAERVSEYEQKYHIMDSMKQGGVQRKNLQESVRIELGMRDFLDHGGFKAFTTTFEDLHGLQQLPGLAVQSLMEDGYGFGAEGDWKTAALVRAMKIMNRGLSGGTSFMEDYTYHLEQGRMKVLGAHMLEVCPSIGESNRSLEVHPLGIGGKADPVRMVFNVTPGSGINVSLMDMGDRFRMLLNPCKVVSPDNDLPNLPVARVVWVPEPDLTTAAEAWIHAGGAHHTGFSTAVTEDMIRDFADIAGIELLEINSETKIREFKKEIRWNDLYYHLSTR